MKLSILSFLLFSSISSVYGEECSLCEGDLPETKEYTLVNYNGVAVACSELAMTLFESDDDDDVCFLAQDAHGDSCCNADSPAPSMGDMADIQPPGLRATVSRGLEFAFPGQSSLFIPANIGGTMNAFTKNAGGVSTSTGSTSSTGTTSDKCTLCHDGSFPEKNVGVVVAFSSFSYSGSCAGLYHETAKLPKTHQICNPLQDAFDWKCGCNPDYVNKDTNNGMGSWGFP